MISSVFSHLPTLASLDELQRAIRKTFPVNPFAPPPPVAPPAPQPAAPGGKPAAKTAPQPAAQSAPQHLEPLRQATATMPSGQVITRTPAQLQAETATLGPQQGAVTPGMSAPVAPGMIRRFVGREWQDEPARTAAEVAARRPPAAAALGQATSGIPTGPMTAVMALQNAARAQEDAAWEKREKFRAGLRTDLDVNRSKLRKDEMTHGAGLKAGAPVTAAEKLRADTAEGIAKGAQQLTAERQAEQSRHNQAAETLRAESNAIMASGKATPEDRRKKVLVDRYEELNRRIAGLYGRQATITASMKAQDAANTKAEDRAEHYRLSTELLGNIDAEIAAANAERDAVVEEYKKKPAAPAATTQPAAGTLEGRTGTTPDGKRYIFRNGQWEPLP